MNVRHPLAIAIATAAGIVITSPTLAAITHQASGFLEPTIGLIIRRTPRFLEPTIGLEEILGFLAGLGTTFAGLPDLLAMLKQRGTAGMKPRMNAITGLFQILWVWYGFLIISRPVVVWNLLGVAINLATVCVYLYFAKVEKHKAETEYL
ncbi:MAG: hypothetical protein HC890_07575 [Chloroflexaceae bacterium]|nr:hypothetical protein [Chloroflexaceae bacterium]